MTKIFCGLFGNWSRKLSFFFRIFVHFPSFAKKFSKMNLFFANAEEKVKN